MDVFGRFIDGKLDAAGCVMYHENRRVGEIPFFAKRSMSETEKRSKNKKPSRPAKEVFDAMMQYVIQKEPKLKKLVLNAADEVVGFWQKMGFKKQKHAYIDREYVETTPMVRIVRR